MKEMDNVETPNWTATPPDAGLYATLNDARHARQRPQSEATCFFRSTPKLPLPCD